MDLDKERPLADDEDLLALIDDSAGGGEGGGEKWRVLVVDDDDEVHRATVFALAGAIIEGRPIEFLHAHSAAQAQARLSEDGDVAVILLDVVMESPDAGLALVRTIREDLALSAPRIVLRTGQPGYAPELSVIRDYDINDYKTKAELTQLRLLTTLTTAIRSYQQICQLNASQRGLDHILRVAAELSARRTVESFAAGIMERLPRIVPRLVGAVLCGRLPRHDDLADVPGSEQLSVIAAHGSHAGLIGKPLGQSPDAALQRRIRLALAGRTVVFDGGAAAFCLGNNQAFEGVLDIESAVPLEPLSRKMLQVLCANLAAGFENACLFERLRHLAYHDALTDLPNRVAFIERVDREVAVGHASRYKVALLDLARFSEFNDALGHRAGDALLIAVARRLRAAMPDRVVVARVSGDAFALFGEGELLQGSGLRALFARPFFVRGHAATVQVRIGLASLFDVESGTELSASDALRNASLALAQAKRDMGFHVSEYSGQLAESTRNRVMMLAELRSALASGRGLVLHYQPQVDMNTDRVIGAEALVRWRRDDGSMVPPDRFIPLAEYTGLIAELGAWALRRACEQIVAWDRSGLPPITLAVNVSAAQFRNEGFVDSVRWALENTSADPHRLELEITESVAMEDITLVVSQLKALKAMGLSVALDDFGCGFSSLSSINQLPFDKVKIDRAFVRELGNADGRADAGDSIARTVMRLAEGLGIGVIAEGVEREAQMNELLAMGCARMQGYFFGQAMPADQFEIWYWERCGHRPPDRRAGEMDA